MPIIVDVTNISICFLIFGAVSFLGLIYIWFYVKETKGLSKVQITQMYSNYKVPGHPLKKVGIHMNSTTTDSYTQQDSRIF